MLHFCERKRWEIFTLLGWAPAAGAQTKLLTDTLAQARGELSLQQHKSVYPSRFIREVGENEQNPTEEAKQSHGPRSLRPR